MNIKGKTGEAHDCIVIPIGKSRAKIGKDGQRVNLSLSLVPNREGRDDYDNTHWITEPTTKEEREMNPDLKLPILGNAREYDNGPKPAPRTTTAPTAQVESSMDGMSDDEIPF